MARDQQLIEEAGISFRLLMQSSQLTGISEDKALHPPSRCWGMEAPSPTVAQSKAWQGLLCVDVS